MTLIDWNPRFELGIEPVDREHRELIDLINALHGAMCRGAAHDKVVAGLGRIYAQIAAHFALEEKLMRDANYRGFDEHKPGRLCSRKSSRSGTRWQRTAIIRSRNCR